MATLTEIKNQVHTIERISEEVFKYEMEISHLHENSEYYIINYNKIYTKQGYNYILKNRDGNFYWATPGAKNFIESEHYPPVFEIKTYEYHKLINEHGDTYLDEYKKPILELEAELKVLAAAEFEKVEGYKEYKEQPKQVCSTTKGGSRPKPYRLEKPYSSSNKVVDDYYVSSYIYGLKYYLDTSTCENNKQDNEKIKSTVPLTDIRNKIYDIKDALKTGSKNIKDIKNKLDEYKDLSTKLTEIKEILENKDQKEITTDEVIKLHIDNLEKYFKQYHEGHEIREDIKFRFDNLEKYVKEKYENETKCFIKFYINEENKEKLKIHLDNIEKYVLDYYEAEAKRILRYY